MSQAGLIDPVGSSPAIPTQFTTDDGTAVPVANNLNIYAEAVAAHGVPAETTGSGDTVTVTVQRASATAATDTTSAGLASFNSTQFNVDANGFVALSGGGLAIDSIHPDSGTDPVVPTAAGLVNIVGSGSVTTVGSLNTLTLQLTGLTNHALLVGAGTTTITKVGPSATSGQVLQSAGASADPAFSTATYPSTATGTGTLLRADGTNWTATTSTYPNTNAVNTLLYASSANVMAELATANNGLLVTSNTGVPSILAGPGATGKVLQSNAAAPPSFSTATFPSTATSTGTILRADGTNWVASTATYPDTTTVNQILYSSATNVVGEITTANNSILSTNGSGVPSFGTSLTNDYTLTSSTASTVRTFTVTNTDNTNASSGALVKAVSGGSSAGDAVFQASTTTTTWSFGSDNSVTSPTADPFVISQGTALGTNNVMSVATSGEINYPLQPAFAGYLPSSDNNVMGLSGTNYNLGAVTALTEIFDQNSDFTTAGVFTAPVTGKYQMSAQIVVTGTTVATDCIDRFVSSNRTWQASFVRAAGNSNFYAGLSVLIDMDAGDTCIFQAQCVGEAGNTDDAFGTSSPFSYFTGYLVC